MPLITLLPVLCVCAVAPAVAGPFEVGLAAAERGDYAKALRLWRPLADKGDAVSQRNLGIMYFNGRGVPQDYVLAHMWCNLAASRFDASQKEGREGGRQEPRQDRREDDARADRRGAEAGARVEAEAVVSARVGLTHVHFRGFLDGLSKKRASRHQASKQGTRAVQRRLCRARSLSEGGLVGHSRARLRAGVRVEGKSAKIVRKG